jgi:hypothetical protein
VRHYHQPHQLVESTLCQQPRTGQDQNERVPTLRLVVSHSSTLQASLEQTGGQRFLVFRPCRLSTTAKRSHEDEAPSLSMHWNRPDREHRLTHSSPHPNSSPHLLLTIQRSLMDTSNPVANPTLALHLTPFRTTDHLFQSISRVFTREAAFLTG